MLIFITMKKNIVVYSLRLLLLGAITDEWNVNTGPALGFTKLWAKLL